MQQHAVQRKENALPDRSAAWQLVLAISLRLKIDDDATNRVKQ